jgi:hypothetical protein
VFDTTRADVEIAALTAIQADMTRRADTDWATVVDVKRRLVTAWRELAARDTVAALRDVKAAADIEDVTEKQPITPAELLPARELQGDMLLLIGRYADARHAYTMTLARERGRARSLYGAGRAAELVGDKAAAASSYRTFLRQLEHGDADRVEIERARNALR